MTLRDNTSSKAAPFSGQQLPVHTQPFAFRAPEEDDESVKMSNTACGRSSASDDATSIVILPALSDFCEGRLVPLLHAGPAAAGISPAFLRALCLQNRQFLFNTNKPFAVVPNFSTRTKQSTSFFLFSTNERSLTTNRESLIANFVARTGKIACATKG
jgi:hypothetical protein